MIFDPSITASYTFNPDRFFDNSDDCNNCDKKVQKSNSNKKVDEDFYYDAVDGIVFPDKSKHKKNEFKFSFNDDGGGNARYLGFEDGKYKVNFAFADYEVTVSNIRAAVIHEVYGPGIRKWGLGYYSRTHYKCFMATIDSRYWSKTTDRFKYHTVDMMWSYYHDEVSNKTLRRTLPKPYLNVYLNYINILKK